MVILALIVPLSIWQVMALSRARDAYMLPSLVRSTTAHSALGPGLGVKHQR